MGVEMYLGQSHQQASGASTVLSNRITAYESICASLESFIGTTNLQGKTYSSAKAYSRQVLVPLLKGCILLDEAIKEACAKLPSEYRVQVDQIDLREDDLRDKIQRAGLMASRYEYLATLERQKETPDFARASHLSRSAGRYMEIEQRLQEKLQKLLAFNSSSVHIFAHIQPLLAAVQQGLKQTNGVWQADKKAFRLPDINDMAWTKTVEEKWGKKENLSYQQVLKKVEQGEQLLEKEIAMIVSHIQSNPSKPLSNTELTFLLILSLSEDTNNQDNMVSKAKHIWAYIHQNFNINELSYEGFLSILDEIAENPTVVNTAIAGFSGKVSDKIDEIASQVDEFFSLNSGFGRLYYGTMVADDISNSGLATSSSVAVGLQSISNFLVKYGGEIKLVTAVYDYTSQVSSGTSEANAAVKTVAHIGIGYASGVAGAKVGAAIGTAIGGPIGTVAGGVVGGVVGFAFSVGLSYYGSTVFDDWYDTNISENVDNLVENTKEIFVDVGDSVSSWFSGLGSAIRE